MSDSDRRAVEARPPAPPVADGVEELFLLEREKILSGCTQCGRCFEVCPMIQDEPALAAADAKLAVRGVLEILHARRGSPEALAWVARCAKSGVCDQHCPEPVSPKMMLRLARIMAYGGLGGTAQLRSREDPDFFNKVHAFARLQLSEDEREQWTVAPASRLGKRP